MDDKAKKQETAEDILSETYKRRDIDQPKGEVAGTDKAEPTRFGDWEVGGRCTDF